MSRTQRGPNDRPPPPATEVYPNDPDIKYPVGPAPDPVPAPVEPQETPDTPDDPVTEETDADV